MAAVGYSLPAAANYFSPPLHASKNRGYRICDQCGKVETPSAKFRLCGGCMTTQYCSPDCQKIHWPSHKPICQHTQSQLSSSSSSASTSSVSVAASSSSSSSADDLAKDLRKFTSAHADLLGWAGFQALQLKRVPSNVRQKAVLISLQYHPQPQPHPHLHHSHHSHHSHHHHIDPHRRFTIQSTHIVPRTYIPDPLVVDDIQRREDRCRRNGGIGTLVVILQCGGISQVMPVEVDPPAKITWDEREDWMEVLVKFVSSGRTDFKPISTTKYGIVYG